jgi:signal transduction histidine kinase
MKPLFKKLFGPFPILPLYGGVFGCAVTLYGIVHFDPKGSNQIDALINALPAGIYTGLSIGVPLYLVKLWLNLADTERKYLIRYYLGILFTTVIYTYIQQHVAPESRRIARIAFGSLTYDYIRNLAPILLVANVLGFLYVKLHNEIKEKERALELVQSQNSIIIENVERSRENIARFLHDRVQASLVTVGMQIAEIGKSLPPADSAKLNSVISELEHIRAVEVRTAAMRLSPDLQVVGIVSAIRNLADSFAPAVQSEVIVESSAEHWVAPSPDKSQAHLGVYRIIEQAMLNAVVHGRPKNLKITISLETIAMSPTLIVEVSNDGAAIGDDVTPGIGTAVTSGWLTILGARQRLTNTPSGLVTFRLELPL